MCQSIKNANSDLKLLIVFLLVMLSTTLVIDFLIIKSGVPDMHVGIIMDSRDAIFSRISFLCERIIVVLVKNLL